VVDFSKRLGSKKRGQKPIDPIEIYDTLDRASDKGPLRPSQKAVLKEWFSNRRAQRDVIVKLHTGQGKTLIGLLTLLSKLNEGLGPAVYLCPNNFLVDQTVEQAAEFGITCVVADPELPSEFVDAEAILVTSVQKLFNGITRFKLAPQSQDVGAIVMDDSHACMDTIRENCTIKVPKDHTAFQRLITLFAGALKHQGSGTFAEIEAGKYDSLLPVPYWDWIERADDTTNLLSKDSDTEELRYVWPLIKDNIRECVCVVSGHGLEITPYMPPLGRFGSYTDARHRLFMSATVTNDAFLVKGLGLTPKTITDPLTYKDEKWSGEKMILLPSMLDDSLNRQAIVAAMAKPSSRRKYGVVVLTPSFAKAEEWMQKGAKVAKANTIFQNIDDLKDGKTSQTLIIANRYDGIDLPDDACRILILDSPPYAQSLIDTWIETCRSGSDVVLTRIARTIEQGLGRAVRGERDYCVIVLLGPDLVNTVRTKKMRAFFSPQTRAQIEIGLEIAQYAKDDITDGVEPLEALLRLISQSLKRDESWKEFYADRMENVAVQPADARALEIFAAEMKAEEEFQKGDPSRALKSVQTIIDNFVSGEVDKAWYLQQMARYTYQTSKSESNDLQIAAHHKNRYLLKPKHGMKIAKLKLVGEKRLERIKQWLAGFENPEQMLLHVDDVFGRLQFGVKAEQFEAALDEMGKALGFETQRPDKEWKEGPDNLWAVREGQFFLFECKNQAEPQKTEINKDESGQMNNSCAWFKSNYPGAQCKSTMISRVKELNKAAGFNYEVEIMRPNKLEKLRKTAKAFFMTFKDKDLGDISEEKLTKRLEDHRLTLLDLMSEYTEKPTT
jgi:replicative superfamily II helicase